MKLLPRDSGNGFNRLDQCSSPRWLPPHWDSGPTACSFTACEKWWYNLVLVFCLIEDMALSLFILENSLQFRKKSCQTEKESCNIAFHLEGEKKRTRTNEWPWYATPRSKGHLKAGPSLWPFTSWTSSPGKWPWFYPVVTSLPRSFKQPLSHDTHSVSRRREGSCNCFRFIDEHSVTLQVWDLFQFVHLKHWMPLSRYFCIYCFMGSSQWNFQALLTAQFYGGEGLK